ncbi:glycosyltransferase [Longimicrobium sp.]|jgi:UDP:flavonoid glycosyltransferase YjiC (YdhE family)|uniref:glycosyltransferase n=1 Tax=Longimicrobium sp. TaxID=2029185 RepID=UPI002F958AC6
MSTSPRRRVLFIGELVTLSHMVRPAVLAATLDPARYEVFFACDPRHLSLLRTPNPFHFIPLQSRLAVKSLEEVALMRDSFYDYATVNHYVREDLQLFATWRPDVVVGDMRQSLVVSSRLAGVPFVNIMNAHWHPTSSTPYESPVNPLGAWLGEPWGGMLFNGLMKLALPLASVGVNLVSLQYGLPVVGADFKSIFSYGDYVAFPDLPELSPLHPLPENAAYVGPCLWTPDVAQPAWWGALPADRPVVYVNLGSSGQPRLLPTVIRALAGLPVSVVVATAGRTDLGPQPANVFVADFLDGLQVARRARLTLCNGGSTAGPQSLAGGTPVLGIPSNMDQLASMRLLVARGAGEMVPEAEASEEGIRDAARRMLVDPRYRRAAGEVAAAIERFDAGSAFNGLLDRAFAARAAAWRAAPAAAHAGV